MKKLLTVFVFLIVSQLQVFAQGNPNYFSGFYLANQPIDDTRIIELFAGDTLKLEWHSTGINTNPNDSLSLSSDITTVLPGASFFANNGIRASAYFHWVPAATDVSLIPYEFTLRVDDNQKPIRGIQILPIKIRVNKPAGITLNNAQVNLNQDIQLQPGSPFNFRLSSVNTNLNDSINITSDANTVLPGAVFTTDNAKQQTSTITWTPTTAHIRANAYNFKVTLTEKSVSGPKQYVYSVNVRVGNVMAVKSEPFYVPSFTAYPNPFSEQLTFNLKNNAASILIYNMLGQQIDEITLPKTTSAEQTILWQNASKHAAGTYIARLITKDNSVQTLKFTKLQ